MFKDKEFIEIEYSFRIKDTLQLIETTNAEEAKKNKVYDSKNKYEPKIICLGQNQIFPKVEEEIKKENKEFELTLAPEDAFGKKNPKLLQLISLSHFRKQNINPYPGLPVNIDNLMGIVRAVSPGRVIVDFNHPLSGKVMLVQVKILRKIDDAKEKVSSLMYGSDKVEIKEDDAIVETNFPQSIYKEMEKTILDLVPEIKKVSFKKSEKVPKQ